MSKQTNILADLEELETGVAHMAVIVSSYYQELVKQGVPQELAFKLSSDFNSVWWMSIMSNNGKQ